MSDKFQLPAEAQDEFKKCQSAIQMQLLRIGSLEADYLAGKNKLLVQLEQLNKKRLDVVSEAAKAGGLDIEKDKWTLNTDSMELVKQA